MQQNNSRGPGQPSSEESTASMERTSVGRWVAPPAPEVGSNPSPRPPQPVVEHEIESAPVVHSGPPKGSVGAPSAGDDGRWVPDPTVQLTRGVPETSQTPNPSTGSHGAIGWVPDNVDETSGYADNGYGDTSAFEGTGRHRQVDDYGVSDGYNNANSFDANGFDAANGYGTDDLHAPNGFGAQEFVGPNGYDSTWGGEQPVTPPHPHDYPGPSGDNQGMDGQDFFDQPAYGDGGLTDGPDPYGSNATGAYDVVDGLGSPGDPGSFGGGQGHGYQDPIGMNPYEGGFGDDEFGGAEPIDAIDNAGRNFDEEELETGMAARRNAIEWAVVLVAAVLLALVLRAVLLQAFYIPSPSMEDTLLVDDRVLVNKLSYRLNDISRGDIVVFHRTDAEIAASSPDDPKDVIKRVIATEGERIEIRDNQVLIDEQLLVEPYLDPNVSMADFGPQIVPDGHIFVMGDNRNLSSDSRGETGPVPEERVVGRAFFLFWPLNRLSAL